METWLVRFRCHQREGSALMPNQRFQPTSRPPLRVVRAAAEPGR